jgi:hypothetical protein
MYCPVDTLVDMSIFGIGPERVAELAEALFYILTVCNRGLLY